MHCLTIACRPKCSPEGVPAGSTMRPDSSAGHLTLPPICQARARKPGGGGAWSPALSGTAESGRDPSAPPAGGGGVSAGPQVALPWPADVRVPDLAGAGGQSATRRGHLGHGPKGHALAEPAEESGAIPQRGQWWPRGRYTVRNDWGGHPSEFRWRPRSGNRAAGLFGFPLQPILICTMQHKRSLRSLLVAPVASR